MTKAEKAAVDGFCEDHGPLPDSHPCRVCLECERHKDNPRHPVHRLRRAGAPVPPAAAAAPARAPGSGCRGC